MILANFTMKKNYKTTIATVIVSAVIISGIFSDSASAVIRINFCSNLVQTISLLDQRIIIHEEALKTLQTNRLNNLKNSRELRDTQLTELKQNVLTNLGVTYAKIEILAKTGEQKTAVSNFKTTMENAINTRKNSITIAASNYRQEIDRIIASRSSAIDTAINNFKNSYQAAVKKSKADCAAGVKPLIAKTTFIASVSAAKTTLITDKQKIGDSSSLIKSASTNYKNTITKANQDFKIVTEKARVDLKAAFAK